jgi:hypothetical protein
LFGELHAIHQELKNADRIVLVAYLADYRSSGVMTFIVIQGGRVYEKDLGPNTEIAAPEINQRRLDSSWHAAE